MKLKYEFDTMEELQEAFKHLEDYHDCEKCRGKIVGIKIDLLGNQFCGYCGEKVRYPQMKKEAFEKWINKIASSDKKLIEAIEDDKRHNHV